MATERYKIKITTQSGLVIYWVKRGRVHTLGRELADMWVKNFKPAIFQVSKDGKLMPPSPGWKLSPLRASRWSPIPEQRCPTDGGLHVRILPRGLLADLRCHRSR